VPKRPRPITAIVEALCLFDARVFSLLGIVFSIRVWELNLVIKTQ
jgi:hypothetical protein